MPWEYTDEISWYRDPDISGAALAGNCTHQVSIDGDTIVAASCQAWIPAGPAQAGQVFVYRRTGLGAWAVEQELIPSTRETSARFGTWVKIIGDTIFVSAPWQDNGGTDRGSVYVFTRSGTTWTQSDEVVGVVDNWTLGRAMTADANRVVAMTHDPTGATAGDTHVYTYAAGVMTPEDSFASATFGTTSIQIGLAIDGDTIVTARQDAGAYVCSVFTRSGSTWTFQQELAGPGLFLGGIRNCGMEIAIRGDLMVTGRPYLLYNPGTALTFTRSGGTWTYQQMILGSEVDRDNAYGEHVDISADGLTIYVTAPGLETGGRPHPGGDIYKWKWNGATWIETWSDGWCRDCYALGITSAAGDTFGSAMEISDEGLLVVQGALIGSPGRTGYKVYVSITAEVSTKVSTEGGELVTLTVPLTAGSYLVYIDGESCYGGETGGGYQCVSDGATMDIVTPILSRAGELVVAIHDTSDVLVAVGKILVVPRTQSDTLYHMRTRWPDWYQVGARDISQETE